MVTANLFGLNGFRKISKELDRLWDDFDFMSDFTERTWVRLPEWPKMYWP